MIRVTVELISGIDKAHNRVLGVMDICNDATGFDPKRGDYTGMVYNKSALPTRNEPVMPARGAKVLREGEVKGYPRQSYNMWRLVIRMLKQCFPEEQ